MKNRIHSLLDKHGLRIPYRTPFSQKNIAWLKKQSFGLMEDTILRSDLAILEVVDEQVKFIEQKIAALAVEDRQVRMLMTMTGVGYFRAMLLLAEICIKDRFSGDKKFSSWTGIAQGVYQFGEKTRIGGVGGPGNRRLRWVIVQYAHTAWQHDPRLKGFYERFCQQKEEKSSVETIAHELARIVYYMLKRNEPYRGRKRGLTDRKNKEMERRALRCLRN